MAFPRRTPRPDTPPGQPQPGHRSADRLRYIPPIAALGTAFVLQTVLVTDTVGTALAARYPDTEQAPWYLLALVLGLSVASCVEGGAAYLMDLYDRHLLAGDSVWLLRLSMCAYVAGSALAVHWWTGQRDLPEVVSWLLAGMSGSALFLWSRGSRWAQRDAMRAAGQLDSAMPRMSTAAKVWHPLRWLQTVRLISWEPVDTVADARARYQAWHNIKTGATASTEQYVQHLVEQAETELADRRTAALVDIEQLRATAAEQATAILAAARRDADRIRAEVSAALTAAEQARAEADTALTAARQQLAEVSARRTADRDRTVVAFNRARPAGRGRTGSEPTVEDLARALDKRFPDSVPGRPTAADYLRGVFGSCSGERATDAKNLLAEWRAAAGQQTAPAAGQEPAAEHTEASA